MKFCAEDLVHIHGYTGPSQAAGDLYSSSGLAEAGEATANPNEYSDGQRMQATSPSPSSSTLLRARKTRRKKPKAEWVLIVCVCVILKFILMRRVICSLNAPMRPYSAYVKFGREIRHRLQEENLSFSDISRYIGAAWRSVDPGTKAQMIQEAGECILNITMCKM